jgi:hypothetical protein
LICKVRKPTMLFTQEDAIGPKLSSRDHVLTRFRVRLQ